MRVIAFWCCAFFLAGILSAEEVESKKEKESKTVSVWLFVTVDCPIANRYVPEINRIYKAYSSRGVEFTLVYPDETLTRERIEKHREEFGLLPPGLLDAKRLRVKKSGATITPEAVVFDRNEKIVYRGRIDDQFTDFGERRSQPTERNLRLALDAVLAGREVDVKETKAIGCLIEDL